MIKVGIVNATTPVAGELIRILINHPDVEIVWVQSSQDVGMDVTHVHQGITGETQLQLCSEPAFDCVDVIFLCHSQGSSIAFMNRYRDQLPPELRIIDLSPDFRLPGDEHDFVYGLSELNRKYMVHDCFHVACPGAFAQTLEIALLPLAKNLMLNTDIHVTAIAGRATGTPPSRHSGNVAVEHALSSPQVPEVEQALKQLQLSFNSNIHFVPMRAGFDRGLLMAAYVKCNVDLDVLRQLYEDYYDDHNFVFIVDRPVCINDVLNTNKCLLNLERTGDKFLITAVIDDAMKGSAGNAVHCMNLLFGLHERVGLIAKSSAF